jgi:hypothetical protein
MRYYNIVGEHAVCNIVAIVQHVCVRNAAIVATAQVALQA